VASFAVDFFGGMALNTPMAEKSMNQMPPEVRRCFIKGNDALLRDNVDYAMDLFNQVLATNPAFYECRKALRAAQQSKSGSSTGFFKKMLSSAGSSPHIAKAEMALRGNPAEAMAVCEQILNSDANNSSAHKIIVRAASALEMPHTAVYSLEVLHNHSPRDRDIAIQFAEALAEIGEVGRGEKILIDLARVMPQDGELGRALKNVSARKTLDEGGYGALEGGQGSYRDILRNEKEAVGLEQEKRVQKTEDVAERLINEYEERLKTEVDSVRLMRQLAELYTQKKQFEKALGYYDRIKAANPSGDSTLDRAIAETIVRRFDYTIEQVNPFAPDLAEQVAKIKAEKLAFQLDECRRRAENFPTDLAIRFELGALYFQAGKIGEAIQEFQKAQSNPHKRIAAMNYLAQCFAKRKMFDLAAKTLQSAIKEKPAFDEEKKDLIYNLGSVLESMGKKEEAIEQFKLIYETDIGYKNVAAKVDAYYAAQ
jgi:tetratricopeptide (TPR) repeat protein